MQTRGLVALDGTGVEVFRNERGTVMHRKPCAGCGEPFELRARLAQRITRCDACKPPTLGATPSGRGYLARDFRPYLEAIVDKIDRRLRASRTAEQDSGAIEALTTEVALLTGKTEEAILRRLYAYRSGETRVIDVSMVEAIFEAVQDELPGEDDLRTYPTTRAASLEIADFEAEVEGVTLTPAELQARADRLYDETLAAVFPERVEREAA